MTDGLRASNGIPGSGRPGPSDSDGFSMIGTSAPTRLHGRVGGSGQHARAVAARLSHRRG